MRIGIDIDGVLTDYEKWQIEVGSKFFMKYNKYIVDPNGYDSDTVFGVNKEMDVKILNSYLSGSYVMHDGNIKEIKLNYNSNLNSGSLFLDKGENKIIVEWPVGQERMIIYKKL